MVTTVLGSILLVAGIFLITAGVVSILVLPGFYTRIVIASKIDVVGFLTCMFGVMLIAGLSMFTLKLLLIVVFEIVTAPLAAHSISHSAYTSGFRVRPEQSDRG